MNWNITITVDTNDADYMEKTSVINDKQLEAIKPIIEGLKAFKPYNAQMAGKTEWEHDSNFPSGECRREDLGEKTPEELYPNIDKGAWKIFNDLLPYNEYGCHTIETIEIAPATTKTVLFEK